MITTALLLLLLIEIINIHRLKKYPRGSLVYVLYLGFKLKLKVVAEWDSKTNRVERHSKGVLGIEEGGGWGRLALCVSKQGSGEQLVLLGSSEWLSPSGRSKCPYQGQTPKCQLHTTSHRPHHFFTQAQDKRSPLAPLSFLFPAGMEGDKGS